VLGLGLTHDAVTIIAELGVLALDVLPEKIRAYVETREAARVARNWDEADRLRSAIELEGYLVKDGPQGPQLSKK
jgi:cysteinyl-tRNA synthetase